MGSSGSKSKFTKANTRLKESGDGLKESGDKLKESGVELKESSDKLKESGDELKESGDELKESGDELKESGDKLKESGNELKEFSDELQESDDTDDKRTKATQVPTGFDFVDAAVVLSIDADGIEEIHLIDDNLKPAFPILTKATTHKNENSYIMNHPRRGKAIIINNKNFDFIGTRSGTDVDATKLRNRLQNKLGFHVHMETNATCQKMKSIFWNASRENHSDADCFVGVILTHGGEEGMLFGTDGEFDQRDIIDYFTAVRCPSLKGKPKIFFIQACRGVEKDDGFKLRVGQNEELRTESPIESLSYLNGVGEDVPDITYVNPSDAVPKNDFVVAPEADFLISFSTCPGFFSFRNYRFGSWYIQGLVKAIDEYGTSHDFLKVLTRVNKTISYSDKYISNTGDKNTTGKKQSPSFSSMLTKDLYFTPKK